MFNDDAPDAPPTLVLRDTLIKYDVAHTKTARVEAYFGDGAPSETRAALRDGHAAREEFVAALRSGSATAIIAAADAHLDCIMRLMATEAVLENDDARQRMLGLIVFTWGSVLDNRARSGDWNKKFAFVDAVFTLVAVATSHCNVAQQQIKSDDVAAYKSLRTAAGVFAVAASLVKANVAKIKAQGNAPMELNAEVLQGLHDATIAQAQQVMVWHTEKEKKRPSMLAKLSRGLAGCYQTALGHFRSGLGGGIATRVMETMGAMADTAAALAHKFQAMHHYDAGEYGVALWHARKAAQLMQEVVGHRFTCEEVMKAVREESAACTALSRSYDEENSTIYFEGVPADNEIAAIKPFVAAKPIAMEMKPAWRDIFAVPDPPPTPKPAPGPVPHGERGVPAGKVEEEGGDVYVPEMPKAPEGKTEMKFACSKCRNVISCPVGTMAIQCPHYCKSINLCIACGKCKTVFSCLKKSDKVKCPTCFATNLIGDL